MIMSSLDTYILEVSAHALLKVATKSSIRGKKYKHLTFLDYFGQKRRSATKKIAVSATDFSLI